MILKDNLSIRETKRTLNPNSNIIVSTIVVLLLYILGSIVSGLILGIIITLQAVPVAIESQNIDALQDGSFLSAFDEQLILGSLIGLIIPIIFIYLFSRYRNKRNNKSLGLIGPNSLGDYLIGTVLGIVSIGIIILVLYVLGQIDIVSNFQNLPIGLFILYIIGWIIQGFSEEFLCRSVMMNLIASKKSIIFAIIANSLIFSLLHFFNNGFTIIPALNIFLVGVVFSLIFYLRDNIWMAASFHSFWNMAQANIFGVSVSGMKLTSASLFKTSFKSNNIINGGDFGVEGGLVCSLLIIIAIIICVKIIKDKDLLVEEGSL